MRYTVSYSRVHPEQLIITQLVKFPASYGTQRSIAVLKITQS